MANTGLAFVCASIGGLQADDDGNEIYVKSPDCLESLRDLQRYLRRDNPDTRDVFLELGKWNVVRQDLVPLIKRYSDDFEIVLNCVKALVFLTMPVDPVSLQVSKQVEYLHQFKAAILEGDAIAVIVSHLEEPLQNLDSGLPKDDDWKLFQLFLTLVRNFLSIPDCLPQHGPSSPLMASLRDQMLERLFNESAMELVVVLTQHVAGRGGLRQDNLLILEIVHQAFWGQQPDLVAAHRGVKVAKKAEKSAATLRAVLESERDQLRKLRKGSSPFTGMFVQVARDGSKTMLTRNPHQSPLENLIRKPQVKRGVIRRIVKDPHPVYQSSDQIYAHLKDFADQFLASGYNILMQSVKEDIERRRPGFETPDILTFFHAAQFFTSYQCYTAQRDQKHQTKSNDGSLDGAENEATAAAAAEQKQLCGLIASTMDESMFVMVISKWHEFADFAVETKDWKPVAAAGGMMKDMIRMLDLVLKRSGNLTKEGQQELRTARILLYKVFYDQTENGILHFLNSLIRSFDFHKQPRSHLANLVEITHIVLRILDSFAKSGESLRVLKKVRGGWKKKPKPSDPPQTEGAEKDATAAKADEHAPESDPNTSPSPRNTTESSPSVDPDPGRSGDEQITGNDCVADGEACETEQPGVELEKQSAAAASPGAEEEDEAIHTSPAAANPEEDEEDEAIHFSPAAADDSDGGKQNRTKEVTLNIQAAVDKFANNTVVGHYCWLLKFHSTNRATTNHYIVRMLQRICEDCMLEPMLYQISLLQTFFSVLSNQQIQAAEDHRFVVGFLSKLVRRLFKKLEAHPILFVEMLFWKSRTDCHHISTDYMLHSLRKETGAGGSSRNQKRISIAEALGDDEEDQPTKLDSDDEGSASSSEDDDVEAEAEISLFSEEQEAEIKDMFERYKGDDQDYAQRIALELEPSGKYTTAQVQRKLQRLGLMEPSAKQSKKVQSERDKSAKGGSASLSPTRKPKRRTNPDGSVARNKSKLFSEDQDQALRELFNRHSSGKNVTKVITENLGGDFTTAQVSRRIRLLGLVTPKPKTARSSLHANLSDNDEDTDQRSPDSLSREQQGNLSTEGRKKHPPKRRMTSHNSIDSDGDEDVLGTALGGPSRRDGSGSTARPEARQPRKRSIESADLDTSSRMLEDSEDDHDSLIIGVTRPSRREEGGPQERHSRRRVTTVDSEPSDSDHPQSRRSIPPPARDSFVDLEDSSDDDRPISRFAWSEPSKAGPRDLDQAMEQNAADLEDSDSGADIVGGELLPASLQEGTGGLMASIGGHHRRRKRVNTVDLSDSEGEGS